MALINSRAEVIEDLWTYPDGVDNGAARPHHIIPFDIVAAVGSAALGLRPFGVFAGKGVGADAVAPFLRGLDLVVVEFPTFRDGRGFTVARALRGRHGFGGDIRAIGHILPDQFGALIACGFTTVVTPAEHPPAQWRADSRSPPQAAGAGPLLQRLIGNRGATPSPHRAEAAGERGDARRI